MIKLTACTALIAAINPCSSLSAQVEEQVPIAIVNGEEIDVEQYKDFLYLSIGSGDLPRIIDSVLITQAANKYKIELAEEDISLRVNNAWLDLLAGANEKDFLSEYEPLGFNKELTLAALRATAITQVKLEKYVVATRVVTDDLLQREFHSKYGFNGVKREVAHIMIMPHHIHAEALRSDAEISFEEAKLVAAERARQCLQELEEGASFTAMVAKYSHDPASNNNQGVLPTYRPGMYGEDFKKIVENLDAPHTATSSIESGAGVHIVRVNSMIVTKLRDVREALSREILNSPANIGEIKQTILELRAAAEISYPLSELAE